MSLFSTCPKLQPVYSPRDNGEGAPMLLDEEEKDGHEGEKAVVTSTLYNAAPKHGT